MKDFTGQRIGSLTARRPMERRIHRHRVWEFACDCGRNVYCLPKYAAERVRRNGTAACRWCGNYRAAAMAPAGRVGAKLRAIRLRSGLRLNDVAARMGISARRVGFIEGLDRPRRQTIERFRAAVWSAVDAVAPAIRPTGWSEDRWFTAMQLRAAVGLPLTPARRSRALS